MVNFEQSLNPDQLEAVRHGEGPQLVLAGAGSGKTRVITYRIAWLVQECGVEPYRIAAVTFTNKAAGEMKERVEDLLGVRPPARLETFVGTFHRFALRLLRRYGDRVGLVPGFTILDTADQLALMKQALQDEDVDSSTIPPRAALSVVSSAKNKLMTVAEYEAQASGYFEDQIAKAYRGYQRLLRQGGAVDFDDMISMAVRLLEREEELGERMRHRLRYLLVDEFQDTNYAQLRLIEAINGRGGNLTAVGDEDQSIYLWRGAQIDHILDFESVFEGAVVRKLERNYRSTQTILDASGGVISHNVRRRGKTLWTDSGEGDKVVLHTARDEGEEARWIVRTMQQLSSQYRFSDMAVLMRTNAQTRALEDELLRRKVPYCLIAGVRFYERAEIKDLVAYLRVIRNPKDNLSLRRILNVPTRGIGKATQQSLFEQAEDTGYSIWDVLVAERFGGLSSRAASALVRFRDLILRLREAAHRLQLHELLEVLLEETGILSGYERKRDEDSLARLENVQEFISAAREFSDDYQGLGLPLLQDAEGPATEGESADGNASTGTSVEGQARLFGDESSFDEEGNDVLTAFLDYVSLVSDTDGLQSEIGVSLMTLHSAKGLEYPVVFLAGLEDGLLPHFNSESPEQLEEERRLLYVGMTRARQRLLLTNCTRRRVAGRFQDQDPSPFLLEVPAELLETTAAPQVMIPAAWRRASAANESAVRSFFSSSGPSTSSSVSPSPPSSASEDTQIPAPTRPPVARPTPPPAVVSPSAARGPTPPAVSGDLELRKGVGVRHPKLGRGVILSVEGTGDNAKLTVYFDKAGRRRLIAKYAALEPLGS